MSVASQPHNVLLLGSRLQGKTSFVERLIGLRGHTAQCEDIAPGPTTSTKVYSITVSMIGLRLVDPGTGNEVRLSPDEETLLRELAEIRQDSLALETIDSDAPEFVVNLIDTPGLANDDEWNIDHIREALETIANYAHSEQPIIEHLSAILIFNQWNANFDKGFCDMYKYYERALPQLFQATAIVNTKFTVGSWSLLHQQAKGNSGRPLYVPRYQSSVKTRYLLKRHEDFLLGFGRSCQHFLLDSKPLREFPFEEFTSRESALDIVQFILAQEPVPLDQMTIPKLDPWRAVDATLLPYFEQIRSAYENKHHLRLRAVSDAAEASSIARAAKKSVMTEIETIKKSFPSMNTKNVFEEPLSLCKIGLEASPDTSDGWGVRSGLMMHVSDANKSSFKISCRDATPRPGAMMLGPPVQASYWHSPNSSTKLPISCGRLDRVETEVFAKDGPLVEAIQRFQATMENQHRAWDAICNALDQGTLITVNSSSEIKRIQEVVQELVDHEKLLKSPELDLSHPDAATVLKRYSRDWPGVKDYLMDTSAVAILKNSGNEEFKAIVSDILKDTDVPEREKMSKPLPVIAAGTPPRKAKAKLHKLHKIIRGDYAPMNVPPNSSDGTSSVHRGPAPLPVYTHPVVSAHPVPPHLVYAHPSQMPPHANDKVWGSQGSVHRSE